MKVSTKTCLEGGGEVTYEAAAEAVPGLICEGTSTMEANEAMTCDAPPSVTGPELLAMKISSLMASVRMAVYSLIDAAVELVDAAADKMEEREPITAAAEDKSPSERAWASPESAEFVAVLT